MIPNHGTDQQDDESPFILFVNVTDVHSLPEGDDGRLASSLVNGVAGMLVDWVHFCRYFIHK